MTIRKWLLRGVMLALASGSSLGCEDTTPSPEAFCGRAATCDNLQVLVAHEPCSQQVSRRLAAATEECRACALSLPCAGMERVANGKVALSQICPACPSASTRAECGDHPHLLICAVATKPNASASASAGPPAPPPPAASAPPPRATQDPPKPSSSASAKVASPS